MKNTFEKKILLVLVSKLFTVYKMTHFDLSIMH